MMRKVVVLHGMYGCDTGCCGHWIKVGSEERAFNFDHPRFDGPSDHLEFAKQLVRNTFGEDHVKDLDWENCHIVEDCDW